MKLVKSLILGSAAGFAAVAGAQAADLPVKKAAPVEYVKVCSTYGAGFFYIPGTDTCLRVSGRVRADYRYNTPGTRASDAVGFFTRGRIQLDARTNTAYGLLRSVVRYELNRGLGFPGSGTNGTITNTSNLAQAFVQFGGLTAGRVTTFFDNGDLPTGHMGTLRFSDSPDVDLIAYTFTFGNGFSATLSLEDGIERRAGLLRAGLTGPDVYGGQRAPDVVGNIKYAGTWGSAQLSAAGHQIRVANPYAIGTFSDTVDTEYGYAVQANVGVNLPMLAPGDALWLNAVYANGALAYITGGSSSSLGLSTGTVSGALVDGYVNANGNLSTGRGWSIAGGLRHYWTQSIRQNVFGSYARVTYSGATPLADFNELRVGTNVFWQPVSGLDIGVEAMYVKLDPRTFVGTGLPINSADHAWEGRVRVQRDF
ncbi:porin [Microvirga pudoricolor]|uniref:porin n=1 Tax=Microvirga pudoricolor TaxID=2778729 RepID=UPI00194EA634|nr:porin [Microvirga pudoricolor]MBM6594337.1 porin [Microvirga pudoricolor]